jgi:SAM-dependent methyltransferase
MSNPFDVLAPTYDSDFTETTIAQYLRKRVHGHLLSLFKNGQNILEMGCGTGEDALFMAQHGIYITATDYSQQMLNITSQKTQHTQRVKTQLQDLNHLQLSEPFDGAYSNFGALNCVANREAFVQRLAPHIREGGYVAFGVMAKTCVWEILWHGLHLEFKIAFRRFKPASFQPDETSTPITVYCPTPKELIADFAPYFECVNLKPLGVFLPPTAGYAVVEKRPRLLKTLLQWDENTKEQGALAPFADHYWIVFRKCS